MTSDEIGNILNDGTWNYTWAQGRQLATMAKSGITWTFTYDASGIRQGTVLCLEQQTCHSLYKEDREPSPVLYVNNNLHYSLRV